MTARGVVLVVEDNELNAKLVRVVLEPEGWEVRVARDAQEAVREIASETPRIVLMDLALPGVDGLELTRRLKADRATRGIPIVAMTAFAMKGDEERARAAGCDGYVTKPMDTRALPAVVARWARRADEGGR